MVVVVALTISGAACSSASKPITARRGALVVLDATTGATRWEQRPTGDHLLLLAGAGAELVIATRARCFDDAPGTGDVAAFDVADGTFVWDAPARSVATKTMFWAASPNADVAARGVIVTPGGRGGRATGLSARTGHRVWTIDGQFLGVSDRLVFMASSVGDRPVLVAHDRETGRREWTFPSSSTPSGRPFDVVAADRTRVVVANGGYLTRFGDGNGDRPGSSTTFSVLAARSGEVRSSFVAADPTYSFSDMVLAAGALVHGEGRSLVARDLATGETRWTHPFDDVPASASGLAGVYLRATDDPGVVLAEIPGAERVVALDARTGSVRWEASPATVRAGGPRVTVLGEAGTHRLVGVDTQTGRQRWRRSVPDAVGGPTTRITTDLVGTRLAIGRECGP